MPIWINISCVPSPVGDFCFTSQPVVKPTSMEVWCKRVRFSPQRGIFHNKRAKSVSDFARLLYRTTTYRNTFKSILLRESPFQNYDTRKGYLSAAMSPSWHGSISYATIIWIINNPINIGDYPAPLTVGSAPRNHFESRERYVPVEYGNAYCNIQTIWLQVVCR